MSYINSTAELERILRQTQTKTRNERTPLENTVHDIAYEALYSLYMSGKRHKKPNA